MIQFHSLKHENRKMRDEVIKPLDYTPSTWVNDWMVDFDAQQTLVDGIPFFPHTNKVPMTRKDTIIQIQKNQGSCLPPAQS